MAQQIKQFRYYTEPEIIDDNDKIYGVNEPADLRMSDLQSSNSKIFRKYFPVTQLGIQGLPGTKFYLNNSTNPIVLGITGTYELNLEGKSEITAIGFDQQSLNVIKNNPNAFLIIDIVYDDGLEVE